VIALPYYRDTHPDFVRSAWGMIEALLGDGMILTFLPADQPS
jgi:hypothetical protein